MVLCTHWVHTMLHPAKHALSGALPTRCALARLKNSNHGFPREQRIDRASSLSSRQNMLDNMQGQNTQHTRRC